MRQNVGLFFAVALTLGLGSSADAAGTVPCAKTTISAKKAPVGPAQYESGSLALANGASMRLQGTKAELSRVAQMAVGDAVAACYGPSRTYADAGPARTITVLDLANGLYYASLVGTWKAP